MPKLLSLDERKHIFATKYKRIGASNFPAPVDKDLEYTLHKKGITEAMQHIHNLRYAEGKQNQVTFEEGLNDALGVQDIGDFLHATGISANMSFAQIAAVFNMSFTNNETFKRIFTGNIEASFKTAVGGMDPAFAMILQGLMKRPMERYFKYDRQSINWIAERRAVEKMEGKIEVVVTNMKTSESKEGRGGSTNDFKIVEKDYKVREFKSTMRITDRMLRERSYGSFQRMISRNAARANSVMADRHAAACLFFDAPTGTALREPAEHYGIEDNTKGIQYLDINRGIDQLSEFGYMPTNAILSQTTRLLNLYKGEQTAPKSFTENYPDITPARQIKNPDNLELLFDKNDAMIETTYGNVETRSERDFDNGDLKMAFVNFAGFVTAQPFARIAIKTDTEFSANDFGNMDIANITGDVYDEYQ